MSITTTYIIYLSIILFAFLVGIINYRKKNPKVLPIVILLGYTFASQLVAYFMAKYLRNNVPVDHFNMPVFFTLWGIFYYRTLDDTRIKKVIMWVATGLVCYSLINTIFIQHLNKTPYDVMKLATLFNLILGGLLLMQMLDISSKENIFTNTFFLIALAVVWFNIISSFYFFLAGFTKKHHISTVFTKELHSYSNWVYYFLLSIAMFFQKKIN